MSPTYPCPNRRRLRVALSVAVVLLGSAALPSATHATSRPQIQEPPDSGEVATACGALWRHPVTAPIVDGFRPPDNPYGSGNRGLEYATNPGNPVVAVAAGTVRFSGSVGRNRFVVIQHGPHLKSTYAYLSETMVTVGENVQPGDRIATADAGFHLTARRSTARDAPAPDADEIYIDPLPLLIGQCFVVKLVPVPTD